MIRVYHEEISHGVTDVPGFQAAGVACDVRNLKNDRLDLSVVYSPQPCVATGVFTKNRIVAAPVRLCQKALAGDTFHGFVANSGNANACTGEQGERDAAEMQRITAEKCGVPADSFFVASTGRIGRELPMDNIRKGIESAVQGLARSPEQGIKSATAILTSDTREKVATTIIDIDGATITLGAMAKGAGMIQPNMATMLAFITTDALITKPLLHKLLQAAVDDSFNAITVDGDMSTNDTVLVLANGVSGITVDESNPELVKAFGKALRDICMLMADKIVGDGERITKVVELLVSGATSRQEAENVARAIGNSLLVKTSWFGNDPNWGRLLDAAGYADSGLTEEKIDLAYRRYPASNDHPAVPALTKGKPQHENLPQWKQVVSERRFTILLNMNLGDASYRLLASDLSEGYVNFNKSE